MKICSIPGCERKSKRKGLCQTHSLRQWRGSKIGMEAPIRSYVYKKDKIECEKVGESPTQQRDVSIVETA